MAEQNALVVFQEKLEAEKPALMARLPKLNEWLTPERWYSVVHDLTRRGDFKSVIEKNPDSLINALKDLASWGLEPDNDEAFINVYNTKQKDADGKEVWLPTAQAQAMYKGMLRRAVESRVVKHAVPDVIRAGEHIEEKIDEKGRYLVHTRELNSKKPIVGAYAIFWLVNGLMDYELMDAEGIESSKKASERLAGKTTPAWQFSYPEMAKKSVLRRGLKRMKGKRDAGYESMMASATKQDMSFDAETTAQSLPPDDLPTGEGEATLVLTPDPQPNGKYITAQAAQDLREQFQKTFGSTEMLPMFVKSLTGRRTSKLGELHLDEIPKFVAELAAEKGEEI